MTIGTLVLSVFAALVSVTGIQAVEENQQSVGVSIEEGQVEQLARCGCNKRKRCNYTQVVREVLKTNAVQLARCGCDKRKRCNHIRAVRIADTSTTQLVDCGCNKRKRSNYTHVVHAVLGAAVAC